MKVQIWDGDRLPDRITVTGTTLHFLIAKRTATFCPLLGKSGQRWILARDGLSAFELPAQPVDATQALNLSAGVSNCKVLRGRSLS
jgi:hypothetical protein